MPWRSSKTVITVRVSVVSKVLYYDYVISTTLKFIHFIPILWLKN